MLKIILQGHENYYGLCDIARIFFGPSKEVREDNMILCQDGPDIEIISRYQNGNHRERRKPGTKGTVLLLLWL